MGLEHTPTKTCNSCSTVHASRNSLYRKFEPAVGVQCRYCGGVSVRAGVVFIAPGHPYSLAGVMPKQVVEQRPAMLCGDCGHLSIALTDSERENGAFRIVSSSEV